MTGVGRWYAVVRVAHQILPRTAGDRDERMPRTRRCCRGCGCRSQAGPSGCSRGGSRDEAFRRLSRASKIPQQAIDVDLPILGISNQAIGFYRDLKMQRLLTARAAILALSLSSSLISTVASAAPVTFTYTTGGDTTGSAPGPYTLTSTDSTYSVLRAINDQAFNTMPPLLDRF